jgi:1-acyl-sn-glycerol-3-phosphate acyltransferase
MVYLILKLLFGPIARLIWIKKVEGLENVPKKGSCIIAANHSSYFDFFSLTAILPRRIYFLAGEIFFKKWWWYPLVKFTGQIKVDRNSSDKTQAKKEVLLILNQGKVVGIFPEGTRSSDGKIGKAFTGVAKFALEAKVPVVPVGISGAYETMSRHDKLPKLKKNIIIKIGKPMYFAEYYANRNDEIVLREIADKIMEEIKSLKMDIKYRRAEEGDLPFILEILNSASGDVKDINHGQFLIAEDKNEIVGCIRIKDVNGYFMLASLAVLPDYKRRGIGSTLIRKIIEENNKRPVFLFCNLKNEGFYKKLGFKIVKAENIPEALKKDYNDLAKRNFAKNTKLLIAMILV